MTEPDARRPGVVEPGSDRVAAALASAFGADRVRRAAPLAAFTTFRTGGPADWFVEVRTGEELVRAIRLAHEWRLPLTILGGGSNVLIGDGGIRGLVVRVHHGVVGRPAGDRVRADAGLTMNGLVRWTIARGLAGVEAWAGTPGTVGGAVFGNAHFGGRQIGDCVASVRLADRTGRCLDVPQAEMEFAYDHSRLQRTGEILIWAEFCVTAGDPRQLRETARRSLAFRKQTQPLHMPSAGCVFQNPDRTHEPVPGAMPPSAGALIDRAGLKGDAIGAARVSTVHANFIVNEGGASAADILALIERCKREVHDRFGVVLREEIVRMGEF